jgi:glycerol uptake facilitator-like aquaporin
MFDLAVLQVSATVRSGPGQWLAEFVAAFGLVGTILACLKARPEALPYAVGLFITAGYWFTSSTSFANPAVAIARSFTDTFSGIRPLDAPGFIVAELLGAAAAAFVFGWLLAPPRAGRRPA